MTKSMALAVTTSCLLPACWWHERADANNDAPVSCIALNWERAEVAVEELLEVESQDGQACVPLLVGDRFMVSAAPPCGASLLSGEPTPSFIAPFAPFCRSEGEPPFVCRQIAFDGGAYEGNIITVELKGEVLLVNWNQVASETTAGTSCRQTFRVSLQAMDSSAN